jgi:LPXTG-site transpeptidase (sortase) family protein
MSDQHLTQLSAHSAEKDTAGRAWRLVAGAVGLFVLLYGAADLSSRVASATLGSNAPRIAFGPLVLLQATPKPTVATTTQSSHASTTPFVPVRLVVASLGIDAAVEQVGKKDDGSIGAPQKFGNVGWYALGPKPGESGNTILDGHVNNGLTTSGVFKHLSQIALGDMVEIRGASSTLVYKVVEVKQYDATASAAEVFDTTGPSRLVLITCDGEWVPASKTFSKRFVVFARLI